MACVSAVIKLAKEIAWACLNRNGGCFLATSGGKQTTAEASAIRPMTKGLSLCHEIVNVVIVDLTGLFHEVVTRAIQIGFHKARPLRIGELHVVQRLQLDTHVRQKLLRRVQAIKGIAEIDEIVEQLPFQGILALVTLAELRVLVVAVEDDEAVGLGDGFGFSHAKEEF